MAHARGPQGPVLSTSATAIPGAGGSACAEDVWLPSAQRTLCAPPHCRGWFWKPVNALSISVSCVIETLVRVKRFTGVPTVLTFSFNLISTCPWLNSQSLWGEQSVFQPRGVSDSQEVRLLPWGRLCRSSTSLFGVSGQLWGTVLPFRAGTGGPERLGSREGVSVS